MTRLAAAALAALALASARPAAAQFRPTPMRVPAAAGAQALPGRFSATAGGEELLVVDPASGAAQLRRHHALLSAAAYPYALPAGTPLAIGRTRDSGADLLADVAYPLADEVYVRFGAIPDPHIRRCFGPAGVVSFVRIMPHGADVLAFPNPTIDSGTGRIDVCDFETALYGGTTVSRSFDASGLRPLEATRHEVSGVRLSRASLAHGVDDLALPTQGGVFLLAHRPPGADGLYASPPQSPYDLTLVPVLVGGASALARPPWLPPSVARAGDALGAAAVDVDLDGLPDLVFAYGSALDVPDGAGGLVRNSLLSVRGTGEPSELAHPAGVWEDLGADPRLAPLRDPVVLRQISLGGLPAAALWDRALDQIVVFWADAEAGALRSWRGAADGRRVLDIRVGDLVGSPAPDLVVAAGDVVLVYPDTGAASPQLAWAAGSPGWPTRGTDHLFSVLASDPDGEISLEWFLGDPYGAPAASATLSAAIEHRVDYLQPAALLCEPPPQTLAVTARATDALGVFAEVRAVLEVPFPPPALALDAAPGEPLSLPPGGTAATFAGAAASRCGGTAFSWGGTLFEALPSWVDEASPPQVRRVVAIPEASYPALLAIAEPTVTLVAVEGAVTSEPAALALALDASGLAVAAHAADVAGLAPGELALLRTVLTSRLATALPEVRLVNRLVGLAPAGAPRVTGARVLASLRDGAEVVLDVLPGGGAEVVVELPVRATGPRGASGVEVRSSGGHLLTPGAALPEGGLVTPGCGCGAAGAGGEALLALLAALALRSRRHARSGSELGLPGRRR